MAQLLITKGNDPIGKPWHHIGWTLVYVWAIFPASEATDEAPDSSLELSRKPKMAWRVCVIMWVDIHRIGWSNKAIEYRHTHGASAMCA